MCWIVFWAGGRWVGKDCGQGNYQNKVTTQESSWGHCQIQVMHPAPRLTMSNDHSTAYLTHKERMVSTYKNVSAHPEIQDLWPSLLGRNLTDLKLPPNTLVKSQQCYYAYKSSSDALNRSLHSLSVHQCVNLNMWIAWNHLHRQQLQVKQFHVLQFKWWTISKQCNFSHSKWFVAGKWLLLCGLCISTLQVLKYVTRRCNSRVSLAKILTVLFTTSKSR